MLNSEIKRKFMKVLYQLDDTEPGGRFSLSDIAHKCGLISDVMRLKTTVLPQLLSAGLVQIGDLNPEFPVAITAKGRYAVEIVGA